MKIFRKTAQLTIFTLLLMWGSGFSASANTNTDTIPALRSGAQVCDADPETETRAVYLPAIWQQVSDTVLTGEAMTELVYKPASFHFDGTLGLKTPPASRLGADVSLCEFTSNLIKVSLCWKGAMINQTSYNLCDLKI